MSHTVADVEEAAVAAVEVLAGAVVIGLPLVLLVTGAVLGLAPAFWRGGGCARCGAVSRSDCGSVCVSCLVSCHTEEVVLTAVYPGADRVFGGPRGWRS